MKALKIILVTLSILAIIFLSAFLTSLIPDDIKGAILTGAISGISAFAILNKSLDWIISPSKKLLRQTCLYFQTKCPKTTRNTSICMSCPVILKPNNYKKKGVNRS